MQGHSQSKKRGQKLIIMNFKNRKDDTYSRAIAIINMYPK
jgi:hypothetical protein